LTFAEEYTTALQKRGDPVELIVVPNLAHFEVIAPGSVAWPGIEKAVFSMLDPKRDTSK
jgi:hypothetical protein